MDDPLWETPVLCFDGEALCSELLEWREKVGLEPELSASASQTAHDLENAETKEEWIEKCVEIGYLPRARGCD
jgi:hypothetical protein